MLKREKDSENWSCVLFVFHQSAYLIYISVQQFIISKYMLLPVLPEWNFWVFLYLKIPFWKIVWYRCLCIQCCCASPAVLAAWGRGDLAQRRQERRGWCWAAHSGSCFYSQPAYSPSSGKGEDLSLFEKMLIEVVVLEMGLELQGVRSAFFGDAGSGLPFEIRTRILIRNTDSDPDFKITLPF